MAASSRGTRSITVPHAKGQRSNNRAKACMSAKKNKKTTAAVNIAMVAERTTATSSTSAAHEDHEEVELQEEEEVGHVQQMGGLVKRRWRIEVQGEEEEGA